MWSYIMAATRRDRRTAVPRQNSVPEEAVHTPRNSYHTRVFSVSERVRPMPIEIPETRNLRNIPPAPSETHKQQTIFCEISETHKQGTTRSKIPETHQAKLMRPANPETQKLGPTLSEIPKVHRQEKPHSALPQVHKLGTTRSDIPEIHKHVNVRPESLDTEKHGTARSDASEIIKLGSTHSVILEPSKLGAMQSDIPQVHKMRPVESENGSNVTSENRNKSMISAGWKIRQKSRPSATPLPTGEEYILYRPGDLFAPYYQKEESEGRKGNWLRRGATRISEFFCRPKKKNNSAVPPDWFFDKFGGQIRLDEPLYQDKATRTLCGIKLAFDPTHPSQYTWLTIVSLAILYNTIFIIVRAIFWELDQMCPAVWFTLDYVCDFIYVIDTIVHAHEGYLEQGLMVRDSRMLLRNYLKSKAWKWDLLSLLPTDIIYFWWHPGTCNDSHLPCPVIVRLNRLLRTPRLSHWFDRTETATSYPNIFRICKVVLGILVLIHWNACMYFAISYGIGFGTDSWVYNLTGYRNETLGHQYIYSFYWSTLTLTTIGETPQPEKDIEYIFVVADFLAGVLIFATIVGNIGSMISNMNVSRVEFQNRMDGVKQYMAFRKVGGELEERVIRWFAYTWQQSGALDEEQVLAFLPDKLKAEIAIRVHLDALRQVRIFQDCEPGLLEALVLKLKLQVFSPGDYICRKGDVGKEMYIVKRGKLQVVGDDGYSVMATLSAGSVFGEVSVLEIAGNRTGNRRTANVRSLGYSDLFCLAKRDLWEALSDYPEARATLTERGCQILRKDGLLDETIFENAQSCQFSMEESVQKLERAVEGLTDRLQNLLTDVGAEQAKIKKRIKKIEVRVSDEDDSDDYESTADTVSHYDVDGPTGSDDDDYLNAPREVVDPRTSGMKRAYSLTADRPCSYTFTYEPERIKSLCAKKSRRRRVVVI